MSWLWSLLWLLAASDVELVTTTAPTSTLRPRSLSIESRQDVSSYYPYPASPPGPYPASPPGPYPAPSYGPPTTELPTGSVKLEFAFDEIVLRCVAEEPFEHIVWTRYACPQQFQFGGEGVHIADGSTVYQGDLYDVHIRGHDGTIISELLIKDPVADSSEGVYQCEAWPHIHGGGSGYSPYGLYQSYTPPKSEVFIIGGNSLLENCYHINTYGPPANKLGGFNNKLSSNDKLKQNLFALKPRRNATDSRKDSNSKKLHYNLKYVDNTLYNVDGVNVTADFFRPSKNLPLDSSQLSQNFSKANTVKRSNHFSGSILNFTGRSNDKFREIFPKLNVRKGKISDEFINSSSYTQ